MAARVPVVMIGVLLALSTATPAGADNLPVTPTRSSSSASSSSRALTTCTWTVVGQSSNCDGLDPLLLFKDKAWPTACTATNDILERTVESTTLPGHLYVQLTYSGGVNHGCRTVAASLYAPDYTGTRPCRVTLVRTSDGTTATSLVARRGGFYSAETQALYDNSVTSYARVSCRWGGHTYTGRTGAY